MARTGGTRCSNRKVYSISVEDLVDLLNGSPEFETLRIEYRLTEVVVLDPERAQRVSVKPDSELRFVFDVADLQTDASLPDVEGEEAVTLQRRVLDVVRTLRARLAPADLKLVLELETVLNRRAQLLVDAVLSEDSNGPA